MNIKEFKKIDEKFRRKFYKLKERGRAKIIDKMKDHLHTVSKIEFPDNYKDADFIYEVIEFWKYKYKIYSNGCVIKFNYFSPAIKDTRPYDQVIKEEKLQKEELENKEIIRDLLYKYIKEKYLGRKELIETMRILFMRERQEYEEKRELGELIENFRDVLNYEGPSFKNFTPIEEKADDIKDKFAIKKDYKELSYFPKIELEKELV